MKYLRCPKCKRLLLKYKYEGYFKIEIKCPKCKNFVVSEQK